MTTGAGLSRTASNTWSQKTMITDRIVMCDPYDIAAVTALGLDNASKFQFINEPNGTYTWLEDSYPAVATTALDDHLSSTTNTVSIDVVNGSLFHVGDVVQIDDELIWVSAVSSNTLTVVRNWGSTTNSSHLSASAMYIRYNARVEGADSTDSPWTEVTTGYNYSTILHKEVNLSRDDMIFPRYGMGNLLDYRIDKNMDALMESLNRIPYYGERVAASGTSYGRSSGGIPILCTTNDAGVTGALTRDDIDDHLQTIYTAGGKTDLILCGPWAQRKISSFYEGFITTERSEQIGGMMIKVLMNPISGKMINVVVDRHCQSDHLYMLDTSHVGFITLDPFFYEELSKTGDALMGETVGEYGFVLAFEKAHSFLTGFSVSS